MLATEFLLRWPRPFHYLLISHLSLERLASMLRKISSLLFMTSRAVSIALCGRKFWKAQVGVLPA
jgi:hypothetical protein